MEHWVELNAAGMAALARALSEHAHVVEPMAG
jgi:hypothetical protein